MAVKYWMAVKATHETAAWCGRTAGYNKWDLGVIGWTGNAVSNGYLDGYTIGYAQVSDNYTALMAVSSSSLTLRITNDQKIPSGTLGSGRYLRVRVCA